MATKITTEIFIERARKIHGDRFDYSKVEYTAYKNKVRIICPKHGEFLQQAQLHLAGSICPICAGRVMRPTSDFVEKAKEVHGDKYDYSKAEYKGNHEKVLIICPEHGEFWQRALTHLHGHGCPKCGIEMNTAAQKIWTQESCYSKAKEYTDLTTFYKECQSAYVIAARNGWLQEYIWLKKKKSQNGYWTQERVFQEASRFSTRKEFRNESPGAYNAAMKHGWMCDYTWFPKASNEKKWFYDTCYQEALKYTSKRDFRIKSVTAYCVARDNGWLAEYTWLADISYEWTFETCMNEAKKYKYYNDFKSKSYEAYIAARKRGWLPNYSWLIKEPVEAWNKKWNYETCYAEAKKYKTRGAFGKHGKGAYDIARKNGWLSDYTWFPDFSDSDSKVDSVYRYFFAEFNAVYVGRTLMYRQHMRDIEHCSMEQDTVYKFAKKHNVDFPEMEIIEENLTIQQGREREDYWLKHYKSLGLKVLNRAATGAKSGSIGSLGSGKWTFEKAFEIAMNYSSVNELCEDYEYLYKISKARGWIEKFDWFRGAEIKIEKQTKWTEETCRAEALKYKTRKDFRANCRGAYDKSKECGWIESYTWLYYYKPNWDYQSCKEEASKYPNRNEFGKNAYGAYTLSRKQGWLDEFYPVPLRRVLDYETCKELASKYNTIAELMNSDRSLYNTLLKKKWLYDFFPKCDK